MRYIISLMRGAQNPKIRDRTRETHFDRFSKFLVLASFQVLRHLAGIAHRLGLGLQQELPNRSISARW